MRLDFSPLRAPRIWQATHFVGTLPVFLRSFAVAKSAGFYPVDEAVTGEHH
jgi:hypothetical protein